MSWYYQLAIFWGISFPFALWDMRAETDITIGSLFLAALCGPLVWVSLIVPMFPDGLDTVIWKKRKMKKREE